MSAEGVDEGTDTMGYNGDNITFGLGNGDGEYTLVNATITYVMILNAGAAEGPYYCTSSQTYNGNQEEYTGPVE